MDKFYSECGSFISSETFVLNSGRPDAEAVARFHYEAGMAEYNGRVVQAVQVKLSGAVGRLRPAC